MIKEKVKINTSVNGKNSNQVINYRGYRFTASEFIIYSLEGLGLIAVISYLFYHSVIAYLVLSPYLLFFLKGKQEKKKEERLIQLNLEFKEGLVSLSSALNAGYSIENAFREALKDLRMIYGEDKIITKEFQHIVSQIDMNITVESILKNLADRSGLEDIRSFAEVFSTAKRSGGDLIMIIKTSVESIGQKIDVNREIRTLMTEKEFEQKIMNFIPFIIIFYVNFSSPGLLKALYGNLFGIGVMSFCLGLYLLAFYLSKKIVHIEI